MRIAVPVLTGLALIALGIWLRRRLTAASLVTPVEEKKFTASRSEDDDAYRALTVIEDARLENESFARAWQDAVRGTTDRLTARIAGSRMAGRSGVVQLRYQVPVPPGADAQTAQIAFAYVVRNEVARRVDAMPRAGGFG
jgi:hypothetical protein